MSSRFYIALSIAVAIAAAGSVAFTLHTEQPAKSLVFSVAPSSTPHRLPLAANILSTGAPSNPFGLIEPIAQFKDRITKKTFGKYITPTSSPVDHDRFTGYHTGVDVEFGDTPVDIPVVAIADGVVVLSKWATGYGGVVVVEHKIAGFPRFSLYGHLDPSSLVSSGTRVKKGQQLGILGDGESEETDGVRKHLHLSFYTGEKLDIRGYVPTQDELSNWVDPLAYF